MHCFSLIASHIVSHQITISFIQEEARFEKIEKIAEKAAAKAEEEEALLKRIER
jgi:hypothetical protein